MSAQHTPGLRQTVQDKNTLGGSWTEFEVLTRDKWCTAIDSRTIVRGANNAPFLDLSIEEYTGRTRRAKFTSVRFEEEAARRLYAVLSAKFGSATIAKATGREG